MKGGPCAGSQDPPWEPRSPAIVILTCWAKRCRPYEGVRDWKERRTAYLDRVRRTAKPSEQLSPPPHFISVGPPYSSR